MGLTSTVTILAAADRACRGRTSAGPSANVARAEAVASRGFRDACAVDLDRALGLGASDPAVLAAVMRLHPDPRRRTQVARLLLASDRAGDAERGAAAGLLLGENDELLLHGRRVGATVSGWVATRPGAPPRLRFRDDAGATGTLTLSPGGADDGPPPVSWWRFAQDVATQGPLLLLAASGPERWASVTLPASPWTGPARARAPRSAPADRPPPLGVVIPIYGDPGSLAQCLRALDLQDVPGLQVVVVDDASPDPEVSRLGQEFCAAPDRIYRRNPLNAGFAAAVNLGLSLCRPGDVLLLNSDVVLPREGLSRLRRAARAEAGIGILAPLSNDAGNTTFPNPAFPAAPLPAAEAAALDAVASRTNAGMLVDLPTVLGSCLYMVQACREAVGPLSHAYGRGYYEDVDLCLRARQHGFRVVAACDTYVSHFSGRSFGADRARLVTHNMAVLDRRFPDHAGLDAASDAADPLRPARAAIERDVRPAGGPWTVLIGRDATAGCAMTARHRALGDDAAILRLAWARRGDVLRVDLAVADAARTSRWPRSLSFGIGPEGGRALGRYLAGLSIARLEVFEPQVLPARLWNWAVASGWPLALVADGRASAEAAATLAAAVRRAGGEVSLLALDRMAMARLPGAVLAGPAVPRPRVPAAVRNGPGRRLGIVMPCFCADAERLTHAAVARLARVPGLETVVLGGWRGEDATRTAGQRGTVTGPMPVDDMAEAVRHYGIDALFLPYRDAFHWVLDAVGTGLPRAHFDWSPEGLPTEPGDLALGTAASDEAVGDRLVTWCLASGTGAAA